jgi:hypothetical protein
MKRLDEVDATQLVKVQLRLERAYFTKKDIYPSNALSKSSCGTKEAEHKINQKAEA